MRSLNDPHRGSLWLSDRHRALQRVGATGETKKAAQRLFGNQALTVKPVTPLSPPRRDTRTKVQTDDPSTSAC
jgi:hypothetical protein